jgi:hypothetical protein
MAILGGQSHVEVLPDAAPLPGGRVKGTAGHTRRLIDQFQDGGALPG